MPLRSDSLAVDAGTDEPPGPPDRTESPATPSPSRALRGPSVGPTAWDTALFDSANAQGHFAPDLNLGNEGPWSVTIPVILTAPQVIIEDVVLDWQHFNNAGAFQGVAR